MTISMYTHRFRFSCSSLPVCRLGWTRRRPTPKRRKRPGRAFEHAPFSGHVSAGATGAGVDRSRDQRLRTPRRCRAADFRQHGSIVSRARGTRCQDNRVHQGDQAGADRWQRGQGDHDEICERRAQVLRQSLLLNFCLPNFYFHATTAYDILRQSGVELGKRDFMGTPPQL
jgi:hypothetical protein